MRAITTTRTPQKRKNWHDVIVALSQEYGRPQILGETVVRILAGRIAGEEIVEGMEEGWSGLEDLWGVVKGDAQCEVVLNETREELF